MCNHQKGSKTQKELLDWIERVYNHMHSSQCIANAVRLKKPVTIIELPKIIDKSQTRLK